MSTTGIWRVLDRDLKLAETFARDLQKQKARLLALSPQARRRAVQWRWRKKFPKTSTLHSIESHRLYRQLIDNLLELLESSDC